MSVPIRLLHVDDDADMAELTSIYLQRENDAFRIETETDPTTALDRVDDDLDAIVCDYDMPKMTGLEFLQEVRREYPDLPFVLFTGQGSEEIASEAIAAGVTDYLQKGYGSDVYTVLANRIANAVEQHRSKRALAESRERLSMFIEHSPLGVIEWDKSFRVRRLNDAAEDILGYDSGELEGESWRRVVAESAAETAEEIVSDLLNDQGGYYSINETVRADGTEIICEWHNRVITDDDGDVVTVFSQFQDVTERQTNRERLERLVDNVPGVIYRTGPGPEWPFELIRGSCEELTGYSETEMVNDVVTASSLVHEKDRDRIEREIAAGVDEDGTYDVVYRLRREDGDVRWAWERGQTIGSESNTVYEGLLIDVDSLKRSELELDRTNRVLATLLENLPFGVLVEDEAREVVVTNQRLVELLDIGADPETLVGADCAQAADDLKDRFAEPETFIEGIDDRLADREPVQAEELVLSDGRILERDYIPYSLNDGGANLWIYRDVSEEREQQTLLNGLFEESLDGIGIKEIITDEEGNPVDYTYERVNERFEELTGLNADDVVGRRATEAIPGIEETPFIDIFGEVGLGGEPRIFEQYSAPLDRYYEIAAFSPRHGQCITIFSNITARKKHQQELERLTEFLRETERLGDLGAWEFDAEGNVHWTEGTRRIYEVDEEYEPTVGTAVQYFHPDDRDRIESVVERALESGETFDEETRLITAKGNERWVRIRGMPIGDEGIVRGYTQDITERRRDQQRLERQKDRLEEFASVVSHDLRNPLNVAQGRVALAMEDVDSDHLGAASNALARMDDLIDDLLLLSQRGAVIGDLEWITLSTVATGCSKSVDTGEATIDIESSTEIRADESRLRQLLENLIRNSIEHGGGSESEKEAEGTDRLRVRIGDLPDGFYVEDNGVGIPESERERIFEHGVTTATGGTGFGLSIVQRIAEAHGWEVAVVDAEEAGDGRLGEGVRFEITGVEVRE